jgi:DNA-binding SARP family transcriptional activator
VARVNSNPGWSTEDQAFLRTATELLDAGQYEHLAEVLHQVQLAYDEKGDAIPAHVLVLARRICLACSQSQAEADWHQQACQEATQREDKLRQQLSTLLDLVSERDLPAIPGEWDLVPAAAPAVLGPPGPELSESTESLSLWQRIQGMLRWRLGPQSPSEVVSEISADSAHAFPGRATEVTDLPPLRPKREAVTSPPTKTEKQKESDPPSLVVYCLGPFRVYQDDQPVDDWPSSKGKAIFKYLVTHRERPVVKEVLMELFWPGAHPDAARNNLNVAIYGLRQALRKERPSFSHVLFQDDCYLLNPDLQIWTDVDQFTARCKAAQEMEQHADQVAAMHEYHAAEVLYEGEFFEEDRYEDWVLPRRQRLQEEYLSLLDRLSLHCLEQEDYSACATLCRQMLTVDPCHEEAHRRLMHCYNRQGQPYLALRQYHLCREKLIEELDVPPTQATTDLYELVRSSQRT